jgi:FKBP-type peptidyl-prolyl cis-trans isomerase
MGRAMRGTQNRALGFLLSITACAACSSPAALPPAGGPAGAVSDEKAILQQELGEMPAPQGPCPERTAANVLTNPRAAVHRTALGLAYCMLTEGPPGVVPGATDTVRVHYTGWTIEGHMFDSSVERGEPTNLPLSGVIRGWTEGLRLMTPGDKARLWIPGHLGYGHREPGKEAGTPPKGTLVFDIELIDVLREAAAQPPEKEPVPAEDKPLLRPRETLGASPAGKQRN